MVSALASVTCGWIVILLANDVPIGSRETLVQRTVEEADVRMSVVLPAVSRAGEPVVVKIRLENRGKIPAYFYHSSSYRDFRVKVHDSKGRSIPMTRFGKTMIGEEGTPEGILKSEFSRMTVRLAPGTECKMRINIARLFDLTQVGEYSLTIRVCVNPDRSDVRMLNLKASRINFTMIEPVE